MNLIDIAPYPAPPALEAHTKNELGHVNSSLARRVEEHVARFAAFWRDYRFTPDQILEQMGADALTWLRVAAESIEHINRLATIVGKTAADFISAENFVPPRAFIVSAEGSVTLSPVAEGFDAWGRPVPQPEPEPTPEPEPQPEPTPEAP